MRHFSVIVLLAGAAVLSAAPAKTPKKGKLVPAEAVKSQYLLPSNTKTMCSWKGQAHYHTLFVNGDANPDAVWHYPDPKEAAAQIKGRMAFWKGVQVVE